MPTARPASFRLTTTLGVTHMCTGCKGCLNHNRFILRPDGRGALKAADVRATESASTEVPCLWCV